MQARAEQLRRLQMAAQAHSKLLFVMRPAQVQAESSPAALRLLAVNQPEHDALLLYLLKRRGPPLDQALLLPARPARLAALLALDLAGQTKATGVKRLSLLCPQLETAKASRQTCAWPPFLARSE